MKRILVPASLGSEACGRATAADSATGEAAVAVTSCRTASSRGDRDSALLTESTTRRIRALTESATDGSPRVSRSRDLPETKSVEVACGALAEIRFVISKSAKRIAAQNAMVPIPTANATVLLPI